MILLKKITTNRYYTTATVPKSNKINFALLPCRLFCTPATIMYRINQDRIANKLKQIQDANQ